MSAKFQLLIVVLALVAATLFSGLFTVSETEKVLVVQLGEIKVKDYKPGLHFKTPFLQTVKRFDSRINTLDKPSELFLTSEKKNVDVDYFVTWKINNLEKYFTSTGGGNIRVAEQRLNEIVRDGLRGQFSRRTIREAVSGERNEIMEVMAQQASPGAVALGIELVDVRIKRIDYPQGVSNSVYERMRAERQRVAKDFRARGEEAKERIQAEADRQSSVLIAEAQRDSEIMRGEGDAKAASIYANAYQADTEFYHFYRSLQAYRNAMSGNNDVMVIKPDSEFFRYFKSTNE